MMQLRETAGDTLTGTVDGVNTVYNTTYTFNPDTVNIYVNGRLKVREWDDGFWVTPPNIVTMKEALLTGDSLEVEYRADVKTGGGAEGGCPSAPIVSENIPETNALENLPGIVAKDLNPDLLVKGDVKATIDADDLKPVLIRPLEG